MAITSEDLLQPVKNTVSPDIFLQLAKETTLKSAVSELIKINNNLKKQAKESTQLKKEMEEEAAEAMTFYKEVNSLLEEMKKSDVKGMKLDDKRMKDLTGHINKVVNKSKIGGISGVNDNSRKVGIMKNASMEVNAKLSKTSVPEIGDELTDAVKKATQALIGTTLSGALGGTSAYKLLTKGMIEDQYEFASEMNKIAFRSKGITDDSRNMQKAFRETNNAVKETGFDISQLQNQMIKGAKRGLKDSQTIAKTGLGLGKIIGVSEQEASTLSDTFFDWNQKLGLSGNQLGSIAHEIKQVSRYSGLVGENLANAVKNSEKYLNQMKSAGNLTAQATKNTIILQAEAQKLGIDDEISDIMTALSSKDDLFKASSETRNLLIKSANFSGQTQNLLDGTIKNSKASLKDLASGAKMVFKQYAGVNVEDVNKLSPAQKANADLKMKRATGKGLGDLERTITVLEASSINFSDKMNNINKELLITTNSEEKLALERKKQDLYLTESMSNSSMFSEAAKNATSFDDAIFRLQNTMNPDQILNYNKELASIAGTFSSELKDKVLSGDKTAIAEAINLSAADAIKKAGGGDYTQRVKTAIKNKDTKKLVSLQEKMSKEQQKLAIKDSMIGDPIEQATQQIKIMNENLVGYTGSALMWAAQTAGSTGIMAGLMTLIVAQGIFGAESIRAWGEILLGGFKGLKGTLASATETGAIGAASSMTAKMSTASAPIAGAATVSPMAAAMSKTAAPVAAESTVLTTATTAAGLSLRTLLYSLAGVTAVVGALTGSYWAGQEAANHFNTEIEDLTMSQLYASKGAGVLTGALNFLTFGIFNSWLGATGSLTAVLAKFNEKIPILSLLAAAVDVVFGTIYGVYKFVVNLFSGIFSAIGLALSPFIDMASSVISAISSIISPFTALNEKVDGMGSLITIVSDLIGGIGTFIGGIAKGIGYLIKMVFTPLAIAFDYVAKTFAIFYKIVLSPALVILNGLKDTFFGLIKVIKGIFNFDFSMIFDGLVQTVSGVVKAIAGFFLQIPIRIWTAIKEIGPMLLNVISSVGKASFTVLKAIWYDIPKFIISSMIGAFKAVFIELPKLIISSIIEAFKTVFVELPKYLWNSLFDGLKSLTQNDMFGPIFEPFLEILKPINEGISAIIDAFSSLMEPFNALLNIFSSNDNTKEGISLLGLFTSTIKTLSSVLGGFIKFALFPIKIAFEAIGYQLKFVAALITVFKNALTFGFKQLLEIIKPINEGISAIIDAFSSLMEPFYALLSIFSPNNNKNTKEGITALGLFTSSIKILSAVLGGFIKFVLFPIKIAFEVIGYQLRFVAGLIKAFSDSLMKLVDLIKYTVNAIISPFKYLYDVLVGHSIIPDLVFAVIDCFTGMASNVLSGLFNFIPKILSYFSNIGTGIISSISSAVNYIKSTNIYSSIVGGFNKAKDAISSFFSPLMDGFNQITNLIPNLLSNIPGISWLFGNNKETVTTASKDNNLDKAVTTASMATENYTKYTPPSQLVVPDNNIVNTASVQPTGNVSIHDKVRRNKAEKEHTSSSNSNINLSELVVLNTEMLHYMMLNEENTAKIVDLLTSTGSLSGESVNQNKGNTKGNSKPRNSPNYNEWQLARYDQNASLQVVTTGA